MTYGQVLTQAVLAKGGVTAGGLLVVALMGIPALIMLTTMPGWKRTLGLFLLVCAGVLLVLMLAADSSTGQ
jgi:hypothetical protein